MSTTIFDVRVRAIECSRCGAPVETPSRGGDILCRYCGAVNHVTTRVQEHGRRGAASMADEIARLSRLKAQLEHPVEGHAYDLTRMPLGWSERDLAGHGAREQLRQAWTQAKATAASARSPDEQRRLLWLAMKLAEAHVQQGQALQARAVLETALELLADAGHRHLVRCWLVSGAIGEGDLASAEGWLEECDPTPEVIELDGAFREAAARVKTAKGDFNAVLALVGARAEDVPLSPSLREPLAALRVHALEALGHDEQAFSQLEAATREHGEHRVLPSLARAGLAPRTRARKERVKLQGLAEERDKQATGLRALSLPLGSIPMLALLLLIPVTIPRCFFDADPFMGAHGYALCPHVCDDCSGPFRIYTRWSHNGGEHSTDGPQYFCQTRTNRVRSMSEHEMEARLPELEPYELSFAPAAATYLTLLVLLLPAASLVALRSHASASSRRAQLEGEMAQLATTLREPVPEPSRPSYAGLGRALLFVLGAALLALFIIALELGLR